MAPGIPSVNGKPFTEGMQAIEKEDVNEKRVVSVISGTGK
jgi:hypothetical protein